MPFVACSPCLANTQITATYVQCLRDHRDAQVRLETAIGVIDIDLYGTRAPLSVCNLLRYVAAGAFDRGTFFRTVRPDNEQDKPVKIDVIQADVRQSVAPGSGQGAAAQFLPIPMERTVKTGLHHVDGAISMARDGPDDATASFFICIGTQPDLDFGGKRNPDGQGFAAFGRVRGGMDVVKQIWMAPADGETLTPPIVIVRATILRRQRLGRAIAR